MKKMWAGFMIALSLMAVIPTEGWAEEVVGEERTQLEDATETKTVTYRLEGEEAIVTGAVNLDSKRIVIPSVTKIEGRYHPVTAIEKEAFKGMKDLRTVIVGIYVESIGEGAFDECPNLGNLVFRGEDPRKVK